MIYRLLFYILLFNNFAIAQNIIHAEGYLYGQSFHTNVDNPLAKTMLVNPNDYNVIQLFETYANKPLNNETLLEIVHEHSLDVATLYFLNKLYLHEPNKHAQDYYIDAINRLTPDNLIDLSFLKDYFVVFVPGFRYEHIDNGANFANQRLLFDANGVDYEMINIDGTGRVGKNVEIIVNRLHQLCQVHNNIIVISVSKGGLETYIALNELIDFEHICSIKSWINVSGILSGSPVADRWAKPFMRFWIAKGLFWARIKVDLKGLLYDMSYIKGKERYKDLRIPSDIYIMNLISTSLGQSESKLFNIPNDSFSPLVDNIVGGGVVVVETASDHFYRDLDMNTRMVALLKYATMHGALVDCNP